MQYERSTTVDLPYAEAVAKVKELLGEQGFGVLSEIDVQATLKEKRNAEMQDYVILGACTPLTPRRTHQEQHLRYPTG
jgi:uncharacterized protein (DUF302 family)